MKKQLLYILMLLFLSNSNAQDVPTSNNKYFYSIYDKTELIDAQIVQYTDDSFVSANDVRYDFQYYANGNLMRQTIFVGSVGTGSWNTVGKIEQDFNSNGLLSTVTVYGWQSSSSQWIEQARLNYFYYSNGRISSIIEQDWDSWTDDWENEEKKDNYIYDTNGNLLSYISYNWSSFNNDWDQSSKYVNTYNSNNLDVEVLQIWNNNNSTWENDTKWEYQYDANSNLTKKEAYIFTSDWDLAWFVDYYYDANIKLDEEKYYQYSGSGITYVNTVINEYSYNGNLDLTTVDISQLNVSNQTYDLIGRRTYSYSYSGTDFTDFELPEETGDATIDLINHTIDIEVENGTDLTSLSPIFTLSFEANADINGTNQISGSTSNDYSIPVTYTITAGNGTVETWVITVTEEETLSVGENDLSIDISIYPNPTTGIINLNGELKDLSSVQIISVMGQMVYERNGDFNTLDLSFLKSGVYFLRIWVKEKQKTLRFIRQ
ncbi:T9SS type A sorting domain-containing protein [Winogradskyella poriferorum]|uniref:T9SS type A sorting domain-containing protein n=1 Tax=Winogradskyella poriferorum TaxID=307627 RepID=UPI003D65749E